MRSIHNIFNKLRAASNWRTACVNDDVKGNWQLRVLSLTVLILAGTAKSGLPARSTVAEESITVFDELSDEGKNELRSIVTAGILPGLRWPDFTNYREEMREFYRADPQLAWMRNSVPTSQARALIALLQAAETKGLRAEDYDALRWAERLERLQSPQRDQETLWIHFDLALTVSAMRYASDLHMGRIDPAHLRLWVPGKRKEFLVSKFLREQIVNSANVADAMEAVEPTLPEYRATIRALERYRGFAPTTDSEPLTTLLKPVKPGDPYPDVPRLTRLLMLLGDLQPRAAIDANKQIYEDALVEAVKHFQERHGLEADGVIGKRTLSALNIPISRRIVQLQLALERWRWLPHEFPESTIVVNIPEFILRAYDANFHEALAMKVIVGRAYKRLQTPIFAGEMKYVIFRPPWNVPLSIQRGEIVPEVEKNVAYLQEKGYVIVDRNGNILSNGEVSDETVAQLRAGSLGIRQLPGPQNSLGLVKFVFPNEHDVYLHGTPAMSLFSQPRRDFSHGCVRVEDPLALAAWVLKDNLEWTVPKMRSAMDGQRTVRAELARPLSVMILYTTAIVAERGEVRFFDDIYGHDQRLDHAIGQRFLQRWEAD